MEKKWLFVPLVACAILAAFVLGIVMRRPQPQPASRPTGTESDGTGARRSEEPEAVPEAQPVRRPKAPESGTRAQPPVRRTKDPQAEAAGVGSIEGVVRDATTNLPLSGITLELQAPKYSRATTDANGAYRFRNLPPGECRLLPQKDGYELQFARPGRLKAGETLTVDIALNPAATLHIHVTDARGQPVTGRIWLRLRGGQMGSGTTLGTEVDMDRNGYAAYRKIAPGQYSLWVSLGGAQSPSKRFEIRPGENTVRFRLK